MLDKTKSELLFESFLCANGLAFEKIEEDTTPRPDYLVSVDELRIAFELKQLAKDENFGVIKDPAFPNIKSHSRTLGDHVRRRIESARKQIQHGADRGHASVLLIYNNVDPIFQAFGTEPADFIAAMYGAPTILVNPETLSTSEAFNGKDQMLQSGKNTSFSAVGHLCDRGGNATVMLFENVFARIKIAFDRLPSCFEVQRVEVSTQPIELP